VAHNIARPSSLRLASAFKVDSGIVFTVKGAARTLMYRTACELGRGRVPEVRSRFDAAKAKGH